MCILQLLYCVSVSALVLYKSKLVVNMNKYSNNPYFSNACRCKYVKKHLHQFHSCLICIFEMMNGLSKSIYKCSTKLISGTPCSALWEVQYLLMQLWFLY